MNLRSQIHSKNLPEICSPLRYPTLSRPGSHCVLIPFLKSIFKTLPSMKLWQPRSVVKVKIKHKLPVIVPPSGNPGEVRVLNVYGVSVINTETSLLKTVLPTQGSGGCFCLNAAL